MINDITPQKALELSREGFNWDTYVQSRLNECIPSCARQTGGRICRVAFACQNDVSLAECTAKVTGALKRLGWKVGDVTPSPEYPKNGIVAEVKW